MLTYDCTGCTGPLYAYLADCIKRDITAGRLAAGEHLPSKRALARQQGVSTITIQNAYDQLLSEGYIYARPRRGYFVAALGARPQPTTAVPRQLAIDVPGRPVWRFDFASNKTESVHFPFSVWAKIMRETLATHHEELLAVTEAGGAQVLRTAIAEHLASFRGMSVDPAQIVVGAGTEYLYGLLIQLLGRGKIYGIENPGYRKLAQIYASHGVTCRYAGLDAQGVRVDELAAIGAEVAHICPNHHFPTGITMPISRRYELLAWANATAGRLIIEDDYDSEFRLNGRPLPTLQSIDAAGRVIYMNTFAKSLSPALRIAYMVLPAALANRFYRELAFYSCTVPAFEQYALAAFISQGYFEKHINRMRLHYGRKRAQVLMLIRQCFTPAECQVHENDSGLHFLLEFATTVPDTVIEQRLATQGIRIRSLRSFDLAPNAPDQHVFLLNYSNLDVAQLPEALQHLQQAMHV